MALERGFFSLYFTFIRAVAPTGVRGRHSPDKNRGRLGSALVSGTRDFEVFNLSGGGERDIILIHSGRSTAW